MECYIVRHAHSNNTLWSSNRELLDEELTDKGLLQIKCIKSFFMKKKELESKVVLLTSPMIRAIETANAIGEVLKVIPVIDFNLRPGKGFNVKVDSMDCRVYGRSRSYYLDKYPGLIIPSWITSSPWPSLELDTALNRSLRIEYISNILFQKSEELVDCILIIVTHHCVHNELLRHLLKIPVQYPSRRIWFDIANVGVTRFSISDGCVYISYINKTDHLPDELKYNWYSKICY